MATFCQGKTVYKIVWPQDGQKLLGAPTTSVRLRSGDIMLLREDFFDCDLVINDLASIIMNREVRGPAILLEQS